jgi:hypothetical protein
MVAPRNGKGIKTKNTNLMHFLSSRNIALIWAWQYTPAIPALRRQRQENWEL